MSGFIGKYEVVRELANGGMAKVVLARVAGPKGFEKRVVVKKILPHLTEDKEFVEMFLSEARTAAEFNHPNVVQVFELGEADGSYYIAMEFIDGPNLRALHRRAHELKVKLKPALIAQIMWHACEGLAYAHGFHSPQTGEPMHLVHRDVSPDNILLSRAGTVKVVDFGIAKGANDGNPHHTRTGSVKGKLAYMAPEQIKGSDLDHRADVYALGVVLYELLTGVKPYRNTASDVKLMHSILYEPIVPLAERRPDLPPTLVQIVDRALAKDRSQRYQDCRELQGDLQAFVSLSGEAVTPAVLAKLVSDLGLGTDPSIPVSPSNGSARTPPPLHPQSGAARTPPAPQAQSGARSPPPLSAPPPPPSPTLVLDDDLVVLVDDKGWVASRLPRVARWAAGAALAVALGVGGTLLALESDDAPVRMAAAPATVPAPAGPASAAAATAPAPNADAAITAPAPGIVPAAARVGPEGGAGSDVVPASARASALATFAVSSNVRGTVKVNGRAVGTAPVRNVRVAPGRVRVELIDPDSGVRKQETFRLTSGDNGTKVLELEDGKLEFRVRPYATVILDGKTMGQTPLTVTALEGRHEITLVNKDLGKEVKLTYTVKPNQVNVVKYILGE